MLKFFSKKTKSNYKEVAMKTCDLIEIVYENETVETWNQVLNTILNDYLQEIGE
jgi:hypothetical protein